MARPRKAEKQFAITSRSSKIAQPDRVEFVLPDFHERQFAIWHDESKYKVICAGRRSGKTKLAASKLSYEALMTGLPYAWVAPTMKNTIEAWRELQTIARQLRGLASVKQDEMLIEFPAVNGSDRRGSVQVISGVLPDNIRGSGLAGYILDEAAYADERLHKEVMMPMLADYDGWYWLISTPKGFNWFYRMFKWGQDEFAGHRSFRFTSRDNPFIAQGVIDTLERTMLPAAFKQEILAEFLDDALGVFRNVESCIAFDPPLDPETGHDYVMGVDWGRGHDYTAISVIDMATKREVFVDRFTGVGWSLQRGRVVAVAEKWRPVTVLAEKNSIGDANVEALQEELPSLSVVPFQMTQPEKKRLVEKLAFALERGDIGLYPDDAANDELRIYTQEISEKSGVIKYGAPAGAHDDTVVARMLAWSLVGEALGDPVILDW